MLAHLRLVRVLFPDRPSAMTAALFAPSLLLARLLNHTYTQNQQRAQGFCQEGVWGCLSVASLQLWCKVGRHSATMSHESSSSRRSVAGCNPVMSAVHVLQKSACARRVVPSNGTSDIPCSCMALFASDSLPHSSLLAGEALSRVGRPVGNLTLRPP